MSGLKESSKENGKQKNKKVRIEKNATSENIGMESSEILSSLLEYYKIFLKNDDREKFIKQCKPIEKDLNEIVKHRAVYDEDEINKSIRLYIETILISKETGYKSFVLTLEIYNKIILETKIKSDRENISSISKIVIKNRMEKGDTQEICHLIGIMSDICLNSKVDLPNYLSTNPKKIISKEEVTISNTKKYYMPVENECIEKIIDIRIKDDNNFENWLCELLTSDFKPSDDPSYYRKRRILIEKYNKIILENSEIRSKMLNFMLDGEFDIFAILFKERDLKEKAISDADSIFRAKTFENQELSTSCNKLKSEIKKLTDEKTSCDPEFESLKTKNEELNQKNNQMKELIDKKCTQNDELEESINDLKGKLINISNKYEFVLIENNNIKTDLANAKGALTEYKERDDFETGNRIMVKILKVLGKEFINLNRFYIDFKDSDDMDKIIFSKVLGNLFNDLHEIGIDLVGRPEEIVKYDANLHELIQNNINQDFDKVEIIEPGWVIGANKEIFQKAKVKAI